MIPRTVREGTRTKMPMPKRIVICADGTWNEPGLETTTNVVSLASAVLPVDRHGKVQVIYYHKGVGTRRGLWEHMVGGGFGVGIDENIEDLYLFLANNYAPGDELFLFGFSRGAYTVRSLAGLIRKCGVLKRDNMRMYSKAYDKYRERGRGTSPSSAAATHFRAAHSWPDLNIRFIGVWDTVGALGIPVSPLRFWNKRRYEFHDVQLSRSVDSAYQALAIDERRKPFLPAIWTQHPEAPKSQVVEQAWFPGVHCDVGGGYKDTGLSNGALLWLWHRAEACGLALDAKLQPQGNPAAPIGDSMTFFYRLLGNGSRALAATTGLHCSTRTRESTVPAYRPVNLSRFLQDNPSPTIYTP
jgi:uncharacterized protein (DUF2235 family)